MQLQKLQHYRNCAESAEALMHQIVGARRSGAIPIDEVPAHPPDADMALRLRI
jgi:hypothetical protein